MADENAEEEEKREITPEELEELFNKNTESFKCLAQMLVSHSSILRHPLYPFPALKDPGIREAFDYVAPTVREDNVGIDVYKAECKKFGIMTISRVIRSLSTDTLNLKYYGISTNQLRALMAAMKLNRFVLELNLEDNWLREGDVRYISEMLLQNNTLRKLILKECRIPPEDIAHFELGFSKNETLRELDLSFNGLGDKGMLELEEALWNNTTLAILNVSHNFIQDEGAQAVARIVEAINLEELDVSWNEFVNPNGVKKLFNALCKNKTVKAVNVAWNGIEARSAAATITKFCRRSKILNRLDISNNRLAGENLDLVRFGIGKSKSLKIVNVTGNFITPEIAYQFGANMLKSALQYLNMDSAFVKKSFIPLWQELHENGKHCLIAGILSNYEILGPDLIEVIFKRARFLAMSPKKPKAQKDVGHFVLMLPDEPIPPEDFQKAVKKFKMKPVQKDKELVKGMWEAFFIKKKQVVDCVALKECYMSYWPDTKLPPPKPKKKKKKKKGAADDDDEEAATTTTEMVTEEQTVTEVSMAEGLESEVEEGAMENEEGEMEGEEQCVAPESGLEEEEETVEASPEA